MINQRRILMCLERLDIGGVETAVLTLCKGYIDAGCKVFVAAKRGIFNKKLESIGANFYEIDYEITNHYVLEAEEELIEYCKKNRITEIHIHQYPCIIYWLPVIMKLKIPYVAYIHSIIPGSPEWFIKTYPVFKTAIPIFFQNASKIVCIAESSKKEIENLFDIPKDKFLITPNSLYMKDFYCQRKFKKIECFGIIARITEEKMKSIENAINIFKEYSKENENVQLLIAGDGQKFDELNEMIIHDENIKLIGKTNEPMELFNKIDVYMGVDRTVLESLACKRLVIISNYDGKSILLTKDNIEEASKQNFSGNNLEETKDIINILTSITEEKYQKIVTDNYNFICKKYDVSKNLYKDILVTNFDKNYQFIFETINNILEEMKG